MNAIVTLNGGEAVTTSLAIAEGTELDHASVILLVRKYLDDLKEFGLVDFKSESTGGRPTEYATLNEQQSTLLLTYMRNSDIVRGFKKRLVKAFWELAKQPAFQIPQTLPDALRLAADLADQNAKVTAQLAIAAPKAEALDLISAGTDTLTVTEAAKVLGVKRTDLTVTLQAIGWVYRQNGSWVAYDQHIRNGYLQYKEATYTDDKTGMECRKPYCHITPKGLAKLAIKIQPRAA